MGRRKRTDLPRLGGIPVPSAVWMVTRWRDLVLGKLGRLRKVLEYAYPLPVSYWTAHESGALGMKILPNVAIGDANEVRSELLTYGPRWQRSDLKSADAPAFTELALDDEVIQVALVLWRPNPSMIATNAAGGIYHLQRNDARIEVAQRLSLPTRESTRTLVSVDRQQ